MSPFPHLPVWELPRCSRDWMTTMTVAYQALCRFREEHWAGSHSSFEVDKIIDSVMKTETENGE